MKKTRSCKDAGLFRQLGAFIGAVCLATQLAQAGEVISDGLTVYQESTLYGDANIVQGVASTNDVHLYFDFDTNEAGVVTDKSGNGNAGTVSGATWASEGKPGGAYVLDGTDDYIQASDSATLNILGSFTISFWCKVSNFTGNIQTFVSKNDNASEKGYIVWVAGGLVECQLWSPGQYYWGLYDFRTTQQQDLTNWTHVVVVWDGIPNSNGTIYVNGVSAGVEATSISFQGTNIHDSTQPLRIGSRSDGSGCWFLGGAIDEVRIYDHALTTPEIRSLYASSATNVGFHVSVPTTIEHLVPQGDIDMGTFQSSP